MKIKDTKFAKKFTEIWNNKFFGNIWVRLALLAFAMNLLIESLSRHSFFDGVSHIFNNFPAFLYNVILIFFTLSIVGLFKRRLFVGFIVCLFWLVLGIGNCVLRSFRKTPLTAPDIGSLDDGLRVMPEYFTKFQMVLVIIGIVVLIAGIVFLAIKSPKTKDKINYFKSAFVVALSFGIVMLLTNIGPKIGFLAENFGNIANAYDTYGFGYCFMTSVFDSGIDKPKDYSDEKVDQLVDEIETLVPDVFEENQEVELDKDEYPNIIYVQLESLFDPSHLKGLEFSEEPIPFLKSLYKEFSSGYFCVPSFGAGTANTEFEVMTGMNLDDFGPGEYPYKTILKDSACESVCFDLKNYGYSTHALHNNDGDFYHRNTVFGKLGYDTFTSIEYIEKYEETPTGWCTDDCLVGEILSILKSTKEQDFIYTISVEGHGDYVPVTEEMGMDITVSNNNVTGSPETFEYYVNLIHRMDGFVEDLITEISKLEEKTIVVFYGDHLPTYNITDDELTNGNIYQTQYVIWNNFGLEKIDKDIDAFQLSATIFSRLGIKGGIISKYHMTNMDNGDYKGYLSNLTLLEYDILYGDCNAYGGKLPYASTNLKMGHKEIDIIDVLNSDEGVTVKGANYTQYSKVRINGEIRSTEYISNTELHVKGYNVNPGDKIVVVQQDASDDILSSTSIYVVE